MIEGRDAETVHHGERMEPGTATLESYAGRADDGLAELSEIGAFYPLIAYPAPADGLEPEESLDPLVFAGVSAPTA